MMRYRIVVDKFTPTLNIKKPLTEALKFPLVFEPGASWEYSVGIDWAGFMVERVSGMDLETYMKKNIWGTSTFPHTCKFFVYYMSSAFGSYIIPY